MPLLENKVERFNIHTRREFFCQKKADRDGVTQETVCAVLRQLGLADLCQETLRRTAVKARLREWLANGTEIPRELRSVFQWGEVCAARLVEVTAFSPGRLPCSNPTCHGILGVRGLTPAAGGTSMRNRGTQRTTALWYRRRELTARFAIPAG